MSKLRWIMITPALLLPAACASAPPAAPPVVWIGGEPSRLAADKAQCEREAAAIDVNQSATYSDPRYGVTSAMAAQIARDNPLMDQNASVRAAAITVCMGDKGWKPQ